MVKEWVVLLEAAGDHSDGAFGARDVGRLLRALDRRGGAVHCPERYAVQVTTTASSPPEALTEVVSRWTDAVGRLGLPSWQLVRAEVFTPDELEQEFEAARREDVAAARS